MEKFWDFKANKYPRPFSKETFKETCNVISKIEDMGVRFEGKRIIDIGCGTGIYALVLCQKAEDVWCLDLSKNMLDILKIEAENKKIDNYHSICVDFKSFDITDYYKKFDIAFASMTPAIKTDEDILKMEKLASNWCVYIGWAGKRINKISDEIFKMHNLKEHIHNGFLFFRENLINRSIKFKEMVFETQWQWKGSIDEAVEEFVFRIKINGGDPDIRLIKDFLSKRFPDNIVETTTIATEGILIYNSPTEGLK